MYLHFYGFIQQQQHIISFVPIVRPIDRPFRSSSLNLKVYTNKNGFLTKKEGRMRTQHNALSSSAPPTRRPYTAQRIPFKIILLQPASSLFLFAHLCLMMPLRWIPIYDDGGGYRLIWSVAVVSLHRISNFFVKHDRISFPLQI